MITPIYTSTSHTPTFEERLITAAVQYSSDPNQQKAFMDGAKWEHGGDCSGWVVLIGLYLLLQLVAGVIGMADGNSRYESPITNKYQYVFPAYNVGFNLAKWLSK